GGGVVIAQGFIKPPLQCKIAKLSELYGMKGEKGIAVRGQISGAPIPIICPSQSCKTAFSTSWSEVMQSGSDASTPGGVRTSRIAASHSLISGRSRSNSPAKKPLLK